MISGATRKRTTHRRFPDQHLAAVYGFPLDHWQTGVGRDKPACCGEQPGYKAKVKDGSLAEVKVSLIHIGGRMKVYYMAKERRVSGRKERFYEIFRIDFLAN
jgi:hypothetical protein